jgi:hypothetical protein
MRILRMTHSGAPQTRSRLRQVLQWAASTAEVMPLEKRTNYNTGKSFDRVSE